MSLKGAFVVITPLFLMLLTTSGDAASIVVTLRVRNLDNVILFDGIKEGGKVLSADDLELTGSLFVGRLNVQHQENPIGIRLAAQPPATANAAAKAQAIYQIQADVPKGDSVIGITVGLENRQEVSLIRLAAVTQTIDVTMPQKPSNCCGRRHFLHRRRCCMEESTPSCTACSAVASCAAEIPGSVTALNVMQVTATLPSRLWTDGATGRQASAVLVRVNATRAYFRRADGTSASAAIANLCAGDRAWIADWAAVNPTVENIATNP